MRCEDCQGLLSQYIDGELDPESRVTVEQHVAECADCQAVLGSLEKLRDVLRQALQIAPPPGFDEAFFAKLAAEKLRQSRPPAPVPWWRRRWSVPVPVALGSILAAVIVLFVSLSLATGFFKHMGARDERTGAPPETATGKIRTVQITPEDIIEVRSQM